jgi:hypothetical protein
MVGSTKNVLQVKSPSLLSNVVGRANREHDGTTHYAVVAGHDSAESGHKDRAVLVACRVCIHIDGCGEGRDIASYSTSAAPARNMRNMQTAVS